MVRCGHSFESRGGVYVGVSEGVDDAPRAESNRHDGTTLDPQEVRLYPQEVRPYHPCTRRWYACEVPVFIFILKSHLGR